jgi:hypothetical protein
MVIKLKLGCDVELTRTFEQEVISRSRKEKDFRGLLALTTPDGTEALSLSLWDQKEKRGGFWTRSFGIMGALARFALGKSPVQVCEVANPPVPTPGQATDHGEGIEATADLMVYQSALRPFQVAPERGTLGRGFPLIWCLINSLHL